MEQLDVYPHLRTYGPVHTQENAMNSDPTAYPFVSEDRNTFDLYNDTLLCPKLCPRETHSIQLHPTGTKMEGKLQRAIPL
jgi:hypothetical protein